MSSKRLFDVMFASCGLVIASPVLAAVALAIYLYDFHNPLYIASRIGRGGCAFRMVKFRSMVVNADRTGVTSTAATDSRITPVGRLVRQLKLDELIQLWNVLVGDMSFVGPRPNVPSGVAVYTPLERCLLEVSPGITDFSSIVFADEGDILKGYPNADVAYDQLIRPWKSELGLFYVGHHGVWIDVQLIALTILAVVSRPSALEGVHRLLQRLGAPAELARLALRRQPLTPRFPPGYESPAVSQP